jgi:predicted NUDIX family phosphoesterase
MTNPKWEEIIVVAKRKKLFENEELTFQGVLSEKDDKVKQIMENLDKYYESMRRGNTEDKTPKSRNAEINVDYKQPIPYVVVRRGKELFVTERLKGAGESRLHGQLSLGMGGHMNPTSSEYDSFKLVLCENLIRELDEELDITRAWEVDIIGLINDDSEEVSQVHLGILGIAELPKDAEVTVKEVEQLAGQWMTVDKLKEKEVYDRLENWSKIVVDIL